MNVTQYRTCNCGDALRAVPAKQPLHDAAVPDGVGVALGAVVAVRPHLTRDTLPAHVARGPAHRGHVEEVLDAAELGVPEQLLHRHPRLLLRPVIFHPHLCKQSFN